MRRKKRHCRAKLSSSAKGAKEEGYKAVMPEVNAEYYQLPIVNHDDYQPLYAILEGIDIYRERSGTKCAMFPTPGFPFQNVAISDFKPEIIKELQRRGFSVSVTKDNLAVWWCTMDESRAEMKKAWDWRFNGKFHTRVCQIKSK